MHKVGCFAIYEQLADVGKLAALNNLKSSQSLSLSREIHMWKQARCFIRTYISSRIV